jgi:hypothetical protein
MYFLRISECRGIQYSALTGEDDKLRNISSGTTPLTQKIAKNCSEIQASTATHECSHPRMAPLQRQGDFREGDFFINFN